MEDRLGTSELGSFPDGLFSLSNYLDQRSPVVYAEHIAFGRHYSGKVCRARHRNLLKAIPRVLVR